MKICFLTHNLSPDNGGGRFSSELIGQIGKLPGIETVVFVREPANIPGVLPLRGYRRLVSEVRGCDLIHAIDGFPYAVIAFILSILFWKKYAVTLVGTGSVKPFYSWRYPLMFISYAFAARLVSISHYTRDRVCKMMPFLSIEVVTLGIDYGKFSQRPRLSDIQRQSISQLRPYLLSVGLLKPRKGYEDALAAFARVAEKFPDLSLVIVGKPGSRNSIVKSGSRERAIEFSLPGKPSGGHKEKLIDRARQLGVEKRVTFLTDVADDQMLAALYQNAELFILLPRDIQHDFEGFGLVFLEAAAAGLPIVGSREGGVSDAMRNDENGFLVDGRNHQQVAAVLEKLLTSFELRDKFSRASRIFAASQNWEKVSESYKKIYDDIVRK